MYEDKQSKLKCPKCKNFLTERNVPGGITLSCWFCVENTMPDDTRKEYINHCWNCGFPISSIDCRRADNPNDGYVCNRCGADLSGWRKEVKAYAR